MKQPAGAIVDGLGIDLDLTEGDLVADALIIAKVIGDDGEVSLSISNSPTLSWIDQLGLIAAASDVIRGNGRFAQGDD